jgi:hypothetical protein
MAQTEAVGAPRQSETVGETRPRILRTPSQYSSVPNLPLIYYLLCPQIQGRAFSEQLLGTLFRIQASMSSMPRWLQVARPLVLCIAAVTLIVGATMHCHIPLMQKLGAYHEKMPASPLPFGRQAGEGGGGGGGGGARGARGGARERGGGNGQHANLKGLNMRGQTLEEKMKHFEQQTMEWHQELWVN